jgi:hypothetical protein
VYSLSVLTISVVPHRAGGDRVGIVGGRAVTRERDELIVGVGRRVSSQPTG